MPKMSPVKIQQPKFHKKRAFVSDICSCCVRRLLTGFQRQERFPALPFYTGLNHVTGHEFKSALQVFGKLFFWPVQVSYERLQCIQFPKQVFWSPRTITANAEETVRGRYRKLFYSKLNIRNGMLWKRSGSRKVRGQGVVKEDKACFESRVAHLVYLFFTTSRSLQSCPDGFRSTSLAIVPWKKING